MQNFKIKNLTLFENFKLKIENSREGITLLLVIVILSALLSISLGIFSVVFNEIQISGAVNDSFVALYAADQGIERTLWRDRVGTPLCNPTLGQCVASETSAILTAGGCYVMNAVKNSGDTTITVVGQYRCGTSSARVVKRGFQLTY